MIDRLTSGVVFQVSGANFAYVIAHLIVSILIGLYDWYTLHNIIRQEINKKLI